MSNWGHSRNGQLLTPRRRKLIGAYYARRPYVCASMPGMLGYLWTVEQRTAYRKWRSGFMQCRRNDG